MSLASDDRGRVPFALVGVLLLLSASVYATGVADRAQPTVQRPAAAAVEDVSRDTRPALRTAVQDAARESAREPVTEPADTPAGRALNDSDPFVDALRLRIAAAAREELSGLTREQADVRANVSLPAIDGSPDSFRQAKSGIEVTPVDDGAAMQVTVRDLTVRASDGDRVVAQRRLNVSLTVETPVLALHERTDEYETRLNRDAIEGEGLARGMTTRLTAVTMARGYGRYTGAPIRNVLGNRHVELSTNAALLAQQRAAFGRDDPAGARAVDIATVRVGVLDVLGGRQSEAADLTKTLLEPNAVHGADGASGEFDPARPDPPAITASPDAAADEAFLDVSDDHSTAGSYRVHGTLETTVLQQTSGLPPEPEMEGWTLVDEQHHGRTTVRTVEGGGSTPTETIREVTTHHEVERHWRRNGSVRTTTAEWTETARVAVRVNTTYAPDDAAPDRSTEPLFERGGAIDGPNLVDARAGTARALYEANGGVDAVAERAATSDGGADDLVREKTVTAPRPAGLDAWIAADRRKFRRTVANVSVDVPRRSIAGGDANAPAQLADELRERRAALVDAPATYDGVADRARVAARVAFLDRVVAALESRAEDTDDRNVDYRDELGDRTTGGVSKLFEIGREGASEHTGVDPYEGASTSSGELVATPNGAPAYLTLQSVDHERVPSVPAGESVHPMTARTTNWVALPYGDAAGGVVDTLLGGGEQQVSLETAAGTLIAANRTAAAGDGPDPELAANREELIIAVRDSVRTAERELCDAAVTGTTIDRGTCRAAVTDSNEQWPTLGRRAQAMANGSYADGFGDALVARGVDDARADEVGVRGRVRLREVGTEESTTVPAETANGTASTVQQLAREEAKRQVTGGMENASQRATRRLTGASRLPAGMPVAPPPYTWVATVNAWSVTVRGEYQRFAVRARGVGPDGTGSTVRYVRDGSTVRFDADDDGDRERLGRSERVDFEAATTVVAVVPPGMPGVGDVDGNRDERSPGWPCPGVDGDDACRQEDEPE